MHFNVSFMRVRSRNQTGKRGGKWEEETEIVLRSFFSSFFLRRVGWDGGGGGSMPTSFIRSHDWGPRTQNRWERSRAVESFLSQPGVGQSIALLPLSAASKSTIKFLPSCFTSLHFFQFSCSRERHFVLNSKI